MWVTSPFLLKWVANLINISKYVKTECNYVKKFPSLNVLWLSNCQRNAFIEMFMKVFVNIKQNKTKMKFNTLKAPIRLIFWGRVQLFVFIFTGDISWRIGGHCRIRRWISSESGGWREMLNVWLTHLTDKVKSPGLALLGLAKNEPSNPLSNKTVSASTPEILGWNHLEKKINELEWMSGVRKRQFVREMLHNCVVFKRYSVRELFNSP